MQLIKPERGVGDIHSCAADMLLFDRALIGGKLINKDSLAEMFHMDKGYGCGWVPARPNSDIFYHGGETYIYKAYNLYAKTEKYGNIYLIQLHPTVAGDYPGCDEIIHHSVHTTDENSWIFRTVRPTD